MSTLVSAYQPHYLPRLHYLARSPFDDRGLDVIVQDWTSTWPGGNVCALDVLFAADPDRLSQYIE